MAEALPRAQPPVLRLQAQTMALQLRAPDVPGIDRCQIALPENPSGQDLLAGGLGSPRATSYKEARALRAEVLMKMIIFVALLELWAAAGCSKKGSDCEVSIGKGIDNFAATIKASAPNPQIQENKLATLNKLGATLTRRCTDDKWSPEVVSCFAAVAAMKDMQDCQAKLSAEQHTKLRDEMREIMMSSMGTRKPGRSGSGAPDGSVDSAAAPAGSAAAPAGSAAAPAGSAAAPAPAGSAAPAPATGANAK